MSHPSELVASHAPIQLAEHLPARWLDEPPPAWDLAVNDVIYRHTEPDPLTDRRPHGKLGAPYNGIEGQAIVMRRIAWAIGWEPAVGGRRKASLSNAALEFSSEASLMSKSATPRRDNRIDPVELRDGERVLGRRTNVTVQPPKRD